jgi:hypothetical protein
MAKTTTTSTAADRVNHFFCCWGIWFLTKACEVPSFNNLLILFSFKTTQLIFLATT